MAGALEARDVDLAIGILAPTQRDLAGESLFHERYVAVTAQGWRPRGRVSGERLTARQLAAASLAVASPTATYHESVPRMLDALGIAERTVVHARHYAALPELVTATDLLAIVPQMYARAMAAALAGAGVEPARRGAALRRADALARDRDARARACVVARAGAAAVRARRRTARDRARTRTCTAGRAQSRQAGDDRGGR